MTRYNWAKNSDLIINTNLMKLDWSRLNMEYLNGIVIWFSDFISAFILSRHWGQIGHRITNQLKLFNFVLIVLNDIYLKELNEKKDKHFNGFNLWCSNVTIDIFVGFFWTNFRIWKRMNTFDAVVLFFTGSLVLM